MPKSIEKKLSDAVDSINSDTTIYLLKKIGNSIDKSTLLQKLLNQANAKIANLKECKQKEDATIIITLLKNKLEYINALSIGGCDVENVKINQHQHHHPMTYIKKYESNLTLLKNNDIFFKLKDNKNYSSKTFSYYNSNSTLEKIDEEYEGIPINDNVVEAKATMDNNNSSNYLPCTSKVKLTSDSEFLSLKIEDTNNNTNINNQLTEDVEQVTSINKQQESPRLPVINKQQVSESKRRATPQNIKKYNIASSTLTIITSVALGVAVAAYLKMLAIGITVTVCCFILTTITCYYYKPKSLVEDNEVKKFLQTEECQLK